MAGKRIKTISKFTKKLLAEGESDRGDFKRTPEGITAEDLVSFANAECGGSIILGVREAVGAKGTQVGIAEGCSVDDATILQITNKALSCIPPVAIVVHIENIDERPFLRVDIPPSESKPHCTPKGVYSRRDGSRNRALHPGELLKMFMQSESRAFAQNFEAAALRLRSDLLTLEASLDRSIRSMGDRLGWAESKFGDTESLLDTILSCSRDIRDKTSDVSTRLRALFRQDSRDDPVSAKVRQEALDKAVEQLSKDKGLLDQISKGRTVSMTADGKAAVELTEADLRAIFDEAVSIASMRDKSV